MDKQIIIALGREYGSGGHLIAEKLAKNLDIPLYDSNILAEAASSKGVDSKHLEQYDEVPRSRLSSRTVRGYSNSPQVNTANMQFDYLRKIAEEGKSFVVVGRCAEEVLKDYKGMISVFILGDMDKKIERIVGLHNVSEREAEWEIIHHDKSRKAYHNYYCKGKWGDSRNYELSVNSSKLGIDGTVGILENYISERAKKL